MNPIARAAIEHTLASSIARERPLAGGDINQAFELTLANGRRLFAKVNDDAPPGLFSAEARGLAWLEAARALRVPQVLSVGSGAHPETQYLLLELIERRAPAADFDERLGRGLAALHRFGAASFGLDHDNFIGSLPQVNAAAASWAEFYRERRLRPLSSRARRAGLLDADLTRLIERVLARLETLVGPEEPPARLHGDLWSGNLHVDEQGAPVLIDPAVYGGHREIDLAMMRLFGGFGRRVFEAYEEAWPLAPGYHERVELYQLYPLLVHLNLFGAGYLGRLGAALARYR